MKKYLLKDAEKGWFIGNFPKAVYRTRDFEIAVKREKKGECVAGHLHKVAREITVVVEGRMRINGKEFKKGDIILINPAESADYSALEDTVTVVVKIPSVKNDKYFTGRKI